MSQKKIIYCNVCGTGELISKFSATDERYKIGDRAFEVMECHNCHIIQTIPQLTNIELGNYYPTEYYPTGPTSDSYYKNFIERFQIDKVKKISPFRQSGKLLDIGCGVGHFVLAARDRGFQAEGIEYSEVAASSGSSRWNLKISTGDFLFLQFPPSSFEIVTMWQVFEHLRQPKEVLIKIHNLLTNDGLLVIAVPNISSLQARVFRKHWYHLDIPRHLFHYSPASLTGLVESCGFRVIKVDHQSREHNYAGILGSVMKLSPPGESFIHKLMRKTIGIYTARFLSTMETSISGGGTFTLIAVKK